MSSQGGGKARDKRSHRNKPYERRQGLLGRLTGTVTRLLPESWVPAWLQEEEDTPLTAEPRAAPATRRNHLNAAPDTWAVQPPVGGVQLREDEDGRLMADAGGGPGIVSAAGPIWPRAGPEDGAGPSAWQPPDRPPPGPGPGPGLDESMARKRRRRQLQRDDDSELSDDSGPPVAHTPAPASAVAAAHTSTTSAAAAAVSSMNTSATAGTSRGRPQPAALGSKRPRFNASALNTSLLSQDEPANTSLNRSGAGASPFYPGPTVYGGAANHRRLRVPPTTSVGPYQVRPRAVPVRAAAAADEASMSTTARRILSVLEGMSTPVTDARRVPLTSPGQRLLDCSFDGQRRAGLYGAHGARLGRRRTDDPPVHRVVSPVKVAVEPNRSLTVARPPPAEDPASRRVTFSSQPTPAAAPTTGGKMRRQKERGHYSSRPEADPEQLPPSPEPLPDVSLPFTNIRPFSLSTSTPKPPDEAGKRPAASAAPTASSAENGDFTFSRPRPVCAPGTGLVNGLAEGDDELTFAFSAPTAVGERQPSVPSPTSASGSGSAAMTTSWGDKFKPAAGTWSCDVCMVTNKRDAAKCVACQTPGGSAAVSAPAAAPKPAPAAPVASSWGDKFKPAAGTWSCDVCMVSNKPDTSKCVACQTPGGPAAKTGSPAAKPAPPPAVTSSWGDKFKPAAGQWTCDTCMLSNKAEAAKCVACETPNASAKATKAAVSSTLSASAAPFVPASSWGENANASKASADPSAAAKSAETWECSTCLVRNKSAVSKCAACESPRPESRAKDSTPYQFGASKPATGAFAFGFGANKASGKSKSDASGFVFGAGTAASKLTDAKAPDADGFVFGATSKTSDESKSSSGGGFTFDASADKPAAAVVFGFGSGATAAGGGSPKTSEGAAKAPAMNFTAGSAGSPVPLKRKQSSVERPAEKPIPELKTGNIMDLLGGGSAGVAKRAEPAAAEANTSSGEETKAANKSTVLPANGGFSFGAPSSGAGTAAGSATFSFGAASQAASGSAPQTTTNTGFSFGGTVAKKQAEAANSDTQDSSDKPPAMFSFGAKSSSADDRPSSGLALGSGVSVTASSTAHSQSGPKTTPATDMPAGGFTFGGKTSGQSDKSAAGFSFGAKTAESSTPPTGAFAFGTNAKPSDSTGKPSSGFSFGAKAPENSDKLSAAFSFGSGTAAKSDKPPDFSFGAKTSESSSDKPPATFSFGSGSAPASKPAGVFAFGSTPAEGGSSTPASGGFSFGAPSNSAGSSVDKPASGGFAFGAAAATKADTAPVFAFGATSNGPAAKKAASDHKPASAVFQFGAGSASPATAASPFGTSAAAPAAAPAPFAFGAKTTTLKATFNFGGGSAAPAATTAPFAFGGAQPSAPTATAPGVFAFGQQPAAPPAPAPAFGAAAFGQSAAPAAPSAGFSFGAGSTPSFNFGGGQQAAPAAAPAAGGVFRFGASAAGAPPAAAPAPAPSAFGAPSQPPDAANPFSATQATMAGRKIRTAKRRTVKK